MVPSGRCAPTPILDAARGHNRACWRNISPDSDSGSTHADARKCRCAFRSTHESRQAISGVDPAKPSANVARGGSRCHHANVWRPGLPNSRSCASGGACRRSARRDQIHDRRWYRRAERCSASEIPTRQRVALRSRRIDLDADTGAFRLVSHMLLGRGLARDSFRMARSSEGSRLTQSRCRSQSATSARTPRGFRTVYPKLATGDQGFLSWIACEDGIAPHTSYREGYSFKGIGCLRPISDPAVPAHTRPTRTGRCRHSGNRTTGGRRILEIAYIRCLDTGPARSSKSFTRECTQIVECRASLAQLSDALVAGCADAASALSVTARSEAAACFGAACAAHSLARTRRHMPAAWPRYGPAPIARRPRALLAEPRPSERRTRLGK